MKPGFTVGNKLIAVLRKPIRARLYIVILFCAAVVASYLELPPAFLPLGGDNVIPAFNGAEMGRYLSAWNQWTELGSSVPQVLAGPPLTDAGFLSFLQFVGFNLVQASWLYLSVFMTVGALGTAYLFRTIFPGMRSSQILSILSGLVFLFNPSLVVDTFKSIWLSLPERAFFPVFLSLFIDGYQKQRIDYSLLCGAVSFVLFARFPVSSAEYLVATLVFVGSYLAVVLITAKAKAGILFFSLRYLALTAVTAVAVNWYLVYPYLLNLQTYTSTLSSFPVNGLAINEWSGIENAIRLLSFWGFYNGYAPYSATYSANLAVLASTIALPCLSFATILMNRSKRVLIVTATSAALVFLAKGNNEPGGQLYAQLVGFSILKVFYVSSILVPFVALSYSLLFPVFYREISLITERFHRNMAILLRYCTGVTLLSVLLLASWPLVTGNVGSLYHQPSERGVNIPSEYDGLRQWLASNGQSGRTLLAYNPAVYITTSWGFQGSQQFYQNYLNTALVTGIGTQYSETTAILAYAYNLEHFTGLDPAVTVDLHNATSQLWNNSQSDPLWILSSAFNDSSGIAWHIQPSGAKLHQISYSLPSVQNWTNYDVISFWVNATSMVELQFGIMDSAREVGWYHAANHVSRTESGWTQVIMRLRTPDYSKFDPAAVMSLLAQIPESSAPSTVELSSIQYARGFYESSTWAQFLGLLGVRWVLEDESLVVGNWTDYAILQDTPMIHSVTSTIRADQLQAVADLIRSGNLDTNGSAIVTGPNASNSYYKAAISVARNNENNYSVKTSSSGPFVLVFDEQFDSRWTLTDSRGSTFDHIEVNGYANAWLIPSGGDSALTLKYITQPTYSLVFWLSISALILSVAYPLGWNVYSRFSRKSIAARKTSETSNETTTRKTSQVTRLSLIRDLMESSGAPQGHSANIGCKETSLGDVKVDIDGHPDVKGSVLSLPLRSEVFSVAIFSEVLEHIPRGTESKALSEIYRILKRDGSLILSTPSAEGNWGKLYQKLDPAFWFVGHRHYNGATVRRFLESNGFTVEVFTKRGGVRELLFSIVTPFAYGLRKIGVSWNPDLESDYSIEDAIKGYTLIVRAHKRDLPKMKPDSFD